VFPFLAFFVNLFDCISLPPNKKNPFLKLSPLIYGNYQIMISPLFPFLLLYWKKKELMPNYNLLINNKEETFEVDFKKDNNQNIY